MSIYRKLFSQALAKAVGGSGKGASVAEQLSRIQPGLTGDEVKALIGEPDRVKVVKTAESRTETWTYSATTLVSNVSGVAAAMGRAFKQGLNDERDQQLLLHFENGVLSAREGFQRGRT